MRGHCIGPGNGSTMSNMYGESDMGDLGTRGDCDDFRFSMAEYTRNGRMNGYSFGGDAACDAASRTGSGAAHERTAQNVHRQATARAMPVVGTVGAAARDALTKAVPTIRGDYTRRHLQATVAEFRGKENRQRLEGVLASRLADLDFEDAEGRIYWPEPARLAALISDIMEDMDGADRYAEVAHAGGEPASDDMAPQLTLLNRAVLDSAQKIARGMPEHYVGPARPGKAEAGFCAGPVPNTPCGRVPETRAPPGAIPRAADKAHDPTNLYESMFWKPTETAGHDGRSTRRPSEGELHKRAQEYRNARHQPLRAHTAGYASQADASEHAGGLPRERAEPSEWARAPAHSGRGELRAKEYRPHLHGPLVRDTFAREEMCSDDWYKDAQRRGELF